MSNLIDLSKVRNKPQDTSQTTNATESELIAAESESTPTPVSSLQSIIEANKAKASKKQQERNINNAQVLRDYRIK